MSWFEKQIQKRKKYDDLLFQESMEDVSAAIMGRHLFEALSSDKIYKNAIQEIFHVLHIKMKDVILSDSVDLQKKFDDVLKIHGVMSRRVKLESGWHKDAVGPLLTVYKDSPNKAVALIPKGISGYTYVDLNSGKRVRINSKNEMLFDEYARCFYKSLPLKALSIKDLMVYIIEQYNFTDLFLFIFMMLITTAIGMLVPQFNKWLFGIVYESKQLILLFALSSFILSYIVSSTLIRLFSMILNTKLQSKQKITVESAVIQRVISLPPTFFKQYMPGDLAQRIPFVSMLCDTLIDSIGVTVITSLFSFVYLGQIFGYAPSLTLTSFIIIFISLITTVLAALIQMNISKKMMEKSANISGKTYTIIKGIQKIKLSAAEKRFFAKWTSDYAKYVNLLYNTPLFLKISPAINIAITLIGTGVIYYISYINKISVANYFAFNSAYGLISAAFMSLAGVATSIANIKPMLDMVKPFLEAVPETSESKEIVTSLNGNIEFTNVLFRYSPDMPYIIDNLSFRINEGEYVAIVGKTGCGKSTLLRLLLGFEIPEKGSIYYDGKDFSLIDKQSLRKKMGTVMQNDKLFLGNIFSNITISAPSATMDDAWEAAEIASIADDIKKMPMGMNTLIVEGQGGISGGQRQRLMIARAVVGKPKILIFDEATSALDNITQKQVSDAIDSLKCTRIVVAHRLSTIKNANRIIYLENGKIVEDGTYDELIKKDGLFAELVRRQRIDTN